MKELKNEIKNEKKNRLQAIFKIGMWKVIISEKNELFLKTNTPSSQKTELKLKEAHGAC